MVEAYIDFAVSKYVNNFITQNARQVNTMNQYLHSFITAPFICIHFSFSKREKYYKNYTLAPNISLQRTSVICYTIYMRWLVSLPSVFANSIMQRWPGGAQAWFVRF